MKKKDNRNKNQIKFEMIKLIVFIQYLLYSKDLKASVLTRMNSLFKYPFHTENCISNQHCV